MALPKPALDLVAGLLVTTNGALVELVHLQADAVQVQRLKGVAHQQPRRFGAVALAPQRRYADADAEHGVTVAGVDMVQAGDADELVVFADDNGPTDVGFA